MGRARKDVVGYRAAHWRIEQARGKAIEYDCACGCGRPAEEWALVSDVDLLWEANPETGHLRGYSLDVLAYEPYARVCHRTMDGNLPPRPKARVA